MANDQFPWSELNREELFRVSKEKMMYQESYTKLQDLMKRIHPPDAQTALGLVGKVEYPLDEHTYLTKDNRLAFGLFCGKFLDEVPLEYLLQLVSHGQFIHDIGEKELRRRAVVEEFDKTSKDVAGVADKAG